jgi:hypothetical protein
MKANVRRFELLSENILLFKREEAQRKKDFNTSAFVMIYAPDYFTNQS